MSGKHFWETFRANIFGTHFGQTFRANILGKHFEQIYFEIKFGQTPCRDNLKTKKNKHMCPMCNYMCKPDTTFPNQARSTNSKWQLTGVCNLRQTTNLAMLAIMCSYLILLEQRLDPGHILNHALLMLLQSLLRLFQCLDILLRHFNLRGLRYMHSSLYLQKYLHACIVKTYLCEYI